MTEVQKVIKYIAISFAIFLIASIIFGIASFVFELGRSFISPDENISEAMQGTKFENVDITKLDIEIGASNLTIKQGESLAVETNNKDIEIEQNEGILHIKQKNTKWHINKEPKSTLILYIPEEVEIKNAIIQMGAGNITIENLNTDSLDLQLGAGKTEINDLIVNNNCNIDGGAGAIIIKNSKINNLDFDLGVGEVNLEAGLTGRSEIDAGVGSLKLNLLGEKEQYKIHAEKGIGQITIDGKDIKNDTTVGEGENYIDIDGGIGEIIIKNED